MDQQALLTEQFEGNRARLRSVAYRMLGSTAEADDAVQETWLRVSRAETGNVRNMGGWLTTAVARVALNMLRARGSRREGHFADDLDAVLVLEDGVDPEQQALLTVGVGTALLVVLDRLSPPERVAFVLHDTFAVPYDEIAPILGRSPAATRQLASRARRRVRSADTLPDTDLVRQQEVVDAFFAAARGGDLGALLEILDPDVELRPDLGPVLRGASEVAGRALRFADPTLVLRPAVVNGAAGVVITRGRRPVSVMGFTIRGDRIVAIRATTDGDRISRIDLGSPGDGD